jgi:hypothetical protein
MRIRIKGLKFEIVQQLRGASAKRIVVGGGFCGGIMDGIAMALKALNEGGNIECIDLQQYEAGPFVAANAEVQQAGAAVLHEAGKG